MNGFVIGRYLGNFPNSGIRTWLCDSERGKITSLLQVRSCVRKIAESTSKFQIFLFDEKINFMVWKSTVEDLLVQQNLDEALEEEKPSGMNDAKWDSIKKKTVNTIWLAIASEIKYN